MSIVTVAQFIEMLQKFPADMPVVHFDCDMGYLHNPGEPVIVARSHDPDCDPHILRMKENRGSFYRGEDTDIKEFLLINSYE